MDSPLRIGLPTDSEAEERAEQVLAEDWGWCIVLARRPYLLWIGCGNRANRTDEWGAFVVAEPGLLQRLFRTVDTRPTVARLHQVLTEIMRGPPDTTRVWSEDRPQDAGPKT